MPTAASQTIEFVLNGRPISIENYSPQTTLLDFLRDQGLTGAKEGCAEGECGACTVVFVGSAEAGSAYRPVNSCLMFLPMVSGHEIYTVESLADGGKLAEAQEALAAAGGSQCGYCTPGFVMSLFAEQHRPGRTGPCDPNELGGNLCRCTGYRPIRDAALSLGPPPDSSFRKRLSRPAPRLDALEYQWNSARFSRPRSVAEFVSLAADQPEVQLIAGGTDLGVESNLRYRRWPHLVSLEAMEELHEFSETEESVRIGAAIPLSDIPRFWRSAPEILRQWMFLFASPAIRNRATLGGNLATASPIGDAAPLLTALDAVVHIAGPGGRRIAPLSSFFVGYRRTVLRRNELLTAIEVPKPLPAYARFYKAAKRRMDDISTVAAAMAMDWDDDRCISRARFAFGGVAATPVRATEAENATVGQRWNELAVERAQNILGRTLRPIGDHRGSAEYRLEVAKSLVEKFWWEWKEGVA